MPLHLSLKPLVHGKEAEQQEEGIEEEDHHQAILRKRMEEMAKGLMMILVGSRKPPTVHGWFHV